MLKFFGSKSQFVICFCLVLFALFSSSSNVFATSASLSTSGTVNVDIMPSRDGGVGTSISASEVNVVTNCRAGYNLSISGPTDRNLYRNGDSTNNTQGQYFTPVDGTSTLKNTSNAWGYSLSANTDSGVFSPLSNTPTLLKTTAQTASQTDIDDDITIYYGVSVSNSLNPGTYEMANNGSIVYQLTMDPSCIDFEVMFNPNGGTGTMSKQNILINESTKLSANSFTAPAMGTSYQNANGTTIPATANKLWTFWGWNTAADGTGDWYKDRESVTNLANQGETITLYAQWKQPTLADLTTSPSGANKTIDHNTMQDMSAAACWNSEKFTAIGTPYGQATLTDSRDGTARTYTVARLQDGYCWMTQNLNLGASTDIILTSDDTDLEEGTTFTLPASNPNDFSTATTEANYNKPTVLNNMTIPDYTVNNTTYSGKVTAYYSFAAATANTSTYNNSIVSEVYTSICPRNWDLPTSRSYANLKSKSDIRSYNGYYNNTKNAGNEPYYFVYGGYRRATGSTINTTSFYNPSSYGYLWMGQNDYISRGKAIDIRSGGIGSTSSGGLLGNLINKYYGLGIRCVADMDDSDYRITFVNTDTGEMQTQIVGLIGENNTATIDLPAHWVRSGYGISGWDTSSSGTNIVYTNNQTITLTSDITLYTVWKQTYNIVYNGNGADAGVMTNVRHINTYENDVFDLFASNYSKTNYGFAGWSFDSNAQPGGSSKIYGPNEAIVAPAGTPGENKILYAVWVQSAGTIQNWQGCSSMNIGDVTALKDIRDNSVYTIAKLADENCWMMENLRLDTAGSSDASKAQGFGGVFAGLADPETSFSSSTTANSLYYSGTQSGTATIDIGTNDNPGNRFPRYSNTNTSSRETNLNVTDDRYNKFIAHSASLGGSIYSFGNYYNWAAAKASTLPSVTAASQPTSICPSGWQLPYGGSTGIGNTSGGFTYLLNAIGASSSNEKSSQILRSYPANYIYSGYAGYHSGGNSYYLSASLSQSVPYMLSIDDDEASMVSSAGTAARSVRCVRTIHDDISDLHYMQDFGILSSSELSDVKASMTEGAQYTLIDKRDQNTYTISKLPDGNIWMTKNLDLPGETTITPYDSNTTSNYTLPASDSTATQRSLYNSGSTTCSSTSPCYSYYTSSVARRTGGDICPKGWQLPSSSTLSNLKNIYSTSATLISDPFRAVYAGGYEYGNFIGGGTKGYYWSSTYHSQSGEFYWLQFDNANNINLSVWADSFYYSVRCVVKE